MQGDYQLPNLELPEQPGGDAGQVRSDEAQVSEGAAPSPVLQSADAGEAHGASGGGAAQGALDGGNADLPDEREAGHHGAVEGDGLPGMVRKMNN